MKLLRTIEETRREAETARCTGRRLALVPTMGALHEGHLALVDEASRRADHVTVSVFVNPTQFGPNEDLDAYPRTLDADLERLRERGGVDVVFAPAASEMYPEGASTWVTVEGLTERLCGRYRPGHFRGVTTIVSKLFLACAPHVAVFGRKDAQQYLVLRRMARDLNFGVEIVGVDTVREADGLAMSSRNRYLNAEERRQARALSEAVFAVRRAVEGGEQRSEALVELMRSRIERESLARLQYAEVVDTERVEPVERIEPGQEVLAAVAVFFGTTRLIDNVFVRAPARQPTVARDP